MTAIKTALVTLVATATLAGCSRTTYQPIGNLFANPAPQMNQMSAQAPQTAMPTVPSASQLPQTTLTAPSVDYLDPRAVAMMSEKDKSEAASAQYFALQTGRPGAPRTWSGDGNISGQVTVGPYVRVNDLDCREFEHKVTTPSDTFSLKGTSCRENGTWSVVTAG